MASKMTQEDFIRRSTDSHGDRYDYSQAIYVNYTTPVTIICKKHGAFKQLPAAHYNGKNCFECAHELIAQKLTDSQDSFLSKCKAIHGDKYDYSKVVYSGQAKTIVIVCPVHGEFEQLANAHVSGKGCYRCSQSTARGSAKGYSRDEFIAVSKSVHGETYDYSQVIYKNSYTRVIIVCRRHGEFKQRPDVHSRGKGCPVCASSKGELLLASILDESGATYLREATFASCKNKDCLPFDFYVPDKSLLIEYHGEQHYAPIEAWGGIEKYNQRIRNDAIKLEWARLSGYTVLIIPYFAPDHEIRGALAEALSP